MGSLSGALVADLAVGLRVEDEHHAALVGVFAVEAAQEGPLDKLDLVGGLALGDAFAEPSDLAWVVPAAVGGTSPRHPRSGRMWVYPPLTREPMCR